MTPNQLSILKMELTSDPTNLGYTAFADIGNDQSQADLLNLIGLEILAVTTLNRDEFLTAILPATLAIAGLSTVLQSKWDRILNVACAAQTINLATVAPVLGIAVTDGVLTVDQANAIGKRPASRAEILFGAGQTVSNADVAVALRGLV